MKFVTEKEIKESNFVIMRDKYTRKPLALAMSEDGLQFTCNKTGKSLYYKNAFFSNGSLKGKDFSIADNIIIEKYVPNLEKNNKFIKEELLWYNKAVILSML